MLSAGVTKGIWIDRKRDPRLDEETTREGHFRESAFNCFLKFFIVNILSHFNDWRSPHRSTPFNARTCHISVSTVRIVLYRVSLSLSLSNCVYKWTVEPTIAFKLIFSKREREGESSEVGTSRVSDFKGFLFENSISTGYFLRRVWRRNFFKGNVFDRWRWVLGFLQRRSKSRWENESSCFYDWFLKRFWGLVVLLWVLCLISPVRERKRAGLFVLSNFGSVGRF